VESCERCKGQKVASITVEDTMDICGHTFAAKVPATQCQACGQIVIQGHDLKLFELRVAVELAKAGIRDKQAFQFLRKALSLDHGGLAHILDVPEEFIGYWEGGAWPVDLRAHAVLRGLILARFDQRPSALDCLGILRRPRTLARTVRVHLVDALGQAAKALQFGSSAHTTPALA
jgi:DNA-binding transcriptional regulator YiaG